MNPARGKGGGGGAALCSRINGGAVGVDVYRVVGVNVDNVLKTTRWCECKQGYLTGAGHEYVGVHASSGSSLPAGTKVPSVIGRCSRTPCTPAMPDE